MISNAKISWGGRKKMGAKVYSLAMESVENSVSFVVFCIRLFLKNKEVGEAWNRNVETQIFLSVCSVPEDDVLEVLYRYHLILFLNNLI